MKKEVLLIAHFCSDFDGKGNNRFNYIANLLAENDFNVELITSDFSHNKKVKRDRVNLEKIKYKVTYISEPIYKKNVSLKRFYSHYIMSTNLKKYLNGRKKPDVIYCAVPSLDVAEVAARYAKKNNIKFIIDIQDLWPEAFKMVFNIPVISNMLFWPMRKQADYIYSKADEIVAVSQTYVNRASKYNELCKRTYNVFLGTELYSFDKLAEQNKIIGKPLNEIWIGYIGTLGHSYDIVSIIDALEILQHKGIKNIKFIIMGDGPLKIKFEKYAKEKGVYCEFKGRLDYGKMVGKLKACDIAVNPIKTGSAGSIINKVGDYAAAGLPVINTQECQEYRDLLNKYNAGFNCRSGDIQDIADKIYELYNNSKVRYTMGKNNRVLAEERFDRKKTYLEILKLIDNI